MTALNALRRSPIRRKPAAHDPEAFEIVTVHGDRYPWPAKHCTEAIWQTTVLDYAFLGDRGTEHFHCTAPQRSRAGWFDLAVFQPNRHVGILTELKVRDRQGNTKQASPKQKAFIAAGIACGYDVRLWLWPDDEREVWETLTGRPFEELLSGALPFSGVLR